MLHLFSIYCFKSTNKENINSSLWIKIPNHQEYMKTIQTLPFTEIIGPLTEKYKILINQNSFGLFKNLKHLLLNIDNACFVLNSSSLNGLMGLNELILGKCEFQLETTLKLSNLNEINKLKLSVSNNFFN